MKIFLAAAAALLAIAPVAHAQGIFMTSGQGPAADYVLQNGARPIAFAAQYGRLSIWAAPFVAGNNPAIGSGNVIITSDDTNGSCGPANFLNVTESTLMGLDAGCAVAGATGSSTAFITAYGLNAFGIGGGGQGGAAIGSGSIVAMGTDSLRNASGILNGVTAVGTGAGKNIGSGASINVHDIALFGTSAGENAFTPNGNGYLTCFGGDACQGASNATTFHHILALGPNTGTTLTTASDLLLMSTGIQTVEPPAASSTHFMNIANTLIESMTTPNVTAGFGTSPTVAGASSGGFTVTVGSTPGSTGTVTFQTAAPNGWACGSVDLTTAANSTTQTGSTATTASFTNYVRTTGVAGNWAAADVVQIDCNGY